MTVFPTLLIPKPFRFINLVLALALIASEVLIANARPCIAFDASFNLFAFGFGGKDFDLGTQDQWSSSM